MESAAVIMSKNPYAPPTAGEVPSDAPLHVSYPVDRNAISDSARLYAISRLELIGAMGGIVPLLIIAVTSLIMDQVDPTWAPAIDRLAGFGLAFFFGCVFGGRMIRQNILRHAIAQIDNSILSQTGRREVTITPEFLTLRVNDQVSRWSMRDVRYLDRKTKRLRAGKQTILQLAPHLPLAIPDDGVFQGITRTEFLKRVKRRCSNICVF